jgi:hypothetical protein
VVILLTFDVCVYFCPRLAKRGSTRQGSGSALPCQLAFFSSMRGTGPLNKSRCWIPG